MKVEVAGIYYDYSSDFDPIDPDISFQRNWRVSAGDYFKYPITIGAKQCFVKRFGKKKENISGYNFLIKAKGRILQGLPQIYDVVETAEKDYQAIYLFTEYIDGETIDVLHRKGFTFLPIKLATDLFNALKSIHSFNFWFPDFDPKNFLRSYTGNFYVIDLDSVYPIENLPKNSMYGSKDYWSPVYNFYREKFGFSSKDLKTIKGDVFNILQLIYLMSLYSFYIYGEGEDLTAISLERLNEYLSNRYRLFLSTMQYCFFKDQKSNQILQKALNYSAFSSLINTCLFTQTNKIEFVSNSSKSVQLNPTINFIVQNNKKYLLSGESYTLQWNVSNAKLAFLDDLTVSLSGTKNFIAKENLLHTLKALNYNSKTKEVKSTIGIIVEPKPEINLSVLKNQIKSGAKTILQWEVKNGKNITVLQNGKEIAKNCPAKGSLNIFPVINNNSNSQNFSYSISSFSNSGNHIETSSKNIIVTVEKKADYTGLYILGLIAVIIIFALINSKNSSSHYSTNYTTDSTSTMTDTTTMAPNISSVNNSKSSIITDTNTAAPNISSITPILDSSTTTADSVAAVNVHKDDYNRTANDAVRAFLNDLNNSDCDDAWNLTYNQTWEDKGKQWFCSSEAFGGVTKVQYIDDISSLLDSEDKAELWVHYYTEDSYNGNKCFTQKIDLEKLTFTNNVTEWMIVKMVNLQEPFSCSLNNSP